MSGPWLHAQYQRFGEYELMKPLGKGGFSEVWQAFEVSTHKLVALKLLVHAEHAAELRREAKALGVVRGHGIVRTLAVALEHDPPFLVLELLEGGDLRRRLQAMNGKLEPPQALLLLERLLEVLARVHAEGVVHGDLKPENVLFDRYNQVKVADFGLSRRIAQRTATLSVSLSLADAKLAGTLDYMAPEQRDGEKPTPRSDVYALGVILHEMLFGERPQGMLAPPSERDPRIPPLVDRVLAAALATAPEDRYANAQAMLKALRIEVWNDAQLLRTTLTGLRERDSLAQGWPFIWLCASVAAPFMALSGSQAPQDVSATAIGFGVLTAALPLWTLWSGLRAWRAKLAPRIASVDKQTQTLTKWREVGLGRSVMETVDAVVKRRKRSADRVIRTERLVRLWFRRRDFWVRHRARRFARRLGLL